eukprot:7193914-Lingulodinium_polyedra.AAC.1
MGTLTQDIPKDRLNAAPNKRRPLAGKQNVGGDLTAHAGRPLENVLQIPGALQAQTTIAAR